MIWVKGKEREILGLRKERSGLREARVRKGRSGSGGMDDRGLRWRSGLRERGLACGRKDWDKEAGLDGEMLGVVGMGIRIRNAKSGENGNGMERCQEPWG
ncbi:hypothetical protein ACH5RR_003598 [Cinchona calisaya]|uniref:Uncharacterized protein n=1 Tax=Cinchona calisaya TaxID=153742 RepID=A0ABD3AVZ9_9GENT